MVIELSGTSSAERKKVTVADFSKMKSHNQRTVMVTSYDYPTSIIADEVGVDPILVGDSYGMGVLGHDTTIPATIEARLPPSHAVKQAAGHGVPTGHRRILKIQ